MVIEDKLVFTSISNYKFKSIKKICKNSLRPESKLYILISVRLWNFKDGGV